MTAREMTMAGAESDPAAALSVPYPPGWLERLIAGIHRVPVASWVVYAILTAASVTLSCSQAWASGELPVGAVRGDLVYWGAFLVALVWIVDYLDRVAGSAFDAFRPALEVTDAEAADLRYRLVVMPARETWLVTIFAFVLTPLYYVVDPVGSLVADLSPLGLVLRAISESFSSAVLLLIIVQLVRQMRAVTRIVASAPKVDLFKPGPLYAFSKLTSRTAIAVVLLIGTSTYVSMLAQQTVTSDISFLLLWLPWVIGIPAMALAAFILPLLGMHSRLVTEKERLQGDVEARLQRLLGEVNHEVDAGDLSRADAFNKTLATLLQQRDVVGKLPTWPWSPGTFRALLTAVALPLTLFLVQRLLSQFL